MPSLLGSIAGTPEDVEGGGGVPVIGGGDEPPTAGILLASDVGAAVERATVNIKHI
jgi:hypothetical protein